MNRIIILYAACILVACNTRTERFDYTNPDSSDHNYRASTKKPDYSWAPPTPKPPIIDNELPNEYQHKKQLFLDSTVSPAWDEAGFKNANKFINFFKQFQLLVRDDRKEDIARLIKFPLRNLKNKKEFLEHYDEIFNPEFKREIKEQAPLEIYRDKNGAMIGNDGQLWFKPKGDGFVIVVMNF